MTKSTTPNPNSDTDSIEEMIFIIRGKKVMLDSDLAIIYGVETRRLNEQVKRNIDRFPEHFMFQLTKQEERNLMSQIATSSLQRTELQQHGGRRKAPHVFSEHGAVMLASVLKSDTAIKASIHVVEAFVRLRQILIHHKELSEKLGNLEAKYDEQFQVVFNAIRELMEPEKLERKPVGFKQKNAKS